MLAGSVGGTVVPVGPLVDSEPFPQIAPAHGVADAPGTRVVPPPAPVLFAQLRLGFVPVCSRRPMIEVVGPQPPIVPTSHRRNVCAHGVSHVPKYTLPKSPRRPRPELRAVALPSNVPLSRAIFKLNSAWNHAVIPPPTVSVERRPQFDAWLVTPNFVMSSTVPAVSLVYLAWLSDRCTVP